MANFPADLYNPDRSEIEQQVSITFTGSTPAQPFALNQVSPKGTINSGALPTVTLVSGTGAQVSTTRDVDTYSIVTNDDTNNVASATFGLSPDNVTYSTILAITQVAAVNDAGAVGLPATIRVPAGWYLKVTLVHMAIGDTTYA